MPRRPGAVGDDRVHSGLRDHCGDMLRRKIGRTQHDPPCNAVKLNQGQGRGKLPVARDQHRAAAQHIPLRPKAASRRKPGQRDGTTGVGDKPLRTQAGRSGFNGASRLCWRSATSVISARIVARIEGRALGVSDRAGTHVTSKLRNASHITITRSSGAMCRLSAPWPCSGSLSKRTCSDRK